MDLQGRKLEAISFLINLHDERVFKKIEDTIKESKKNEEKSFTPFTQNEIIARAKKANEDYANGKTMSQEKLEKESESW